MTHRPPLAIDAIAAVTGSSYPEPFASRMGESHWRVLGDHFGLTQFGVSHETLAPGAQSSLRHWHTLNDEFVLMLEGELELRSNAGTTLLRPGMCMGFKAGDRNAHHLVNASAAPAGFLVVGSRVPGDVPFYPDDDLAVLPTEAGRITAHKDGSPYR
jgi:uncharacterized cupin superfamily protein